LITRSKIGRTVTVRLRPEPIREAMDWLRRYERVWSQSLDRLAAYAERKEAERRKKSQRQALRPEAGSRRGHKTPSTPSLQFKAPAIGGDQMAVPCLRWRSTLRLAAASGYASVCSMAASTRAAGNMSTS